MTKGCFLLSAVLAAAASISGCASKCGSACPPVELQIWAYPGEGLNWSGASWEGAACPPYLPSCRGDAVYPCLRFGIIAVAPGVCDLTITFKDRPTLVVHGQFGPTPTEGCCRGFPVVGDSFIYVPPIGGFPDAGPDGDGAAESADAADADASATF